MSRFCAVVRAEAVGDPRASGTEVAGMLRAMPAGPVDGQAVWSDGPVGLGAARPASPLGSECPPLAAGHLAVVGDVRLDNRDELRDVLRGDLDALGLRGAPGDGPVVLAAFARWGTAAVERLVGAFAFVVWDRADRRLTAVRDPIGIRPLFYFVGSGPDEPPLVVASEPYGVLAARGVPLRIDEAQVAEALTQRLFSPSRTSFVGVDKLEAGHVLVQGPTGVSTRRYWTPRARPPSGRDVAEEFRDLFDRAVRDRTRTPAVVGVELSGGLDSTAVAVTASRELRGRSPLHTFSARFDQTGRVDESPYIDAVLDALPHARAHSFYPDRERFVDLYREIFERTGVYRLGGNGHFNYLSARAAAEAGVGVLLTGQDGDTAVGHGWELFAERAAAGEGGGLRREADAITRRLSDELDRYDGQFALRSPTDVASAFLMPLLRESTEDKRLGRAWNVARTLTAEFAVPPGLIARRLAAPLLLPSWLHRLRRRRADRARAAEQLPPVVPGRTARAIGLTERLADDDHALREGRRRRLRAAEHMAAALVLPHMGSNFERLDAFCAPYGIEARHPFMDVRLLEFSLGLPVDERLRGGFTRSVLRRALADRIPPEVASRANKAHLGAAYDRFVLAEPERLEEVLGEPGGASGLVDVEEAQRLLRRGDELGGDEILWLANAVTTVLWANGARVERAASPSGEPPNGG